MKKNKIVFTLIFLIFIIIIAILLIFLNKENSNNVVFEYKKIKEFNYKKDDFICKKDICPIGKIKLDNKYINLAYSIDINEIKILINNNICNEYIFDNIISIKKYDKYIVVLKKDFINTENGQEEITNYDFIDNTCKPLDYEKISKIDIGGL